MAERRALVQAEAAAWAALPLPSTAGGYEAAALYLHAGSRVTKPCEIEDHLVLVRREARREAEASAETIVAVIDAVLIGLGLSAEARTRGREIAAEELRRAAEASAR